MGKTNYKNKLIFLKEISLNQMASIDHNIPNNRDINTGKPNKPLFIALPDFNNKKIYWAVPVTIRVQKYKELQKNSNFKEKFQFYHFNGKEACFNISGMFPIHINDISNIYLKNGSPIKLKYTESKSIRQTVKKILSNNRLKKMQLILNVDALYKLAQQRENKPLLTISRPANGKERSL